jgi:hypothetical protein
MNSSINRSVDEMMGLCTYQRSNHLTRSTPKMKEKGNNSNVRSPQYTTWTTYIAIKQYQSMHMKLQYARSQPIAWQKSIRAEYMTRLFRRSDRIMHSITHITLCNAPCGAKVNDDQLLLRSCLEKNRFHFFEGLGLEHLPTSHAKEGRELPGDTENRRCRASLGLLRWASTGRRSHGCSRSLCRAHSGHDGQKNRHQAAEP